MLLADNLPVFPGQSWYLRASMSALHGVLAACVVMLCVFALNALLLTPRRRAESAEAVLRAANDGTLARTHAFGPLQRLMNIKALPLYAQDCSLWRTIAVQGDTPAESTFRTSILSVDPPATVDARAPGTRDCQLLLRGIQESPAQRGDHDRYILAQRALGAVLLPRLGVDGTAVALLVCCYALLALTVSLSLWRWRRSGGQDVVAVVPAVYAMLLACFYGLAHFGRMLTFAPMDSIHFVMLSLAVLWPWGSLKPTPYSLLLGAYGALIAVCEFLTGGIALALIVLLTAIGQLRVREYATRLAFDWRRVSWRLSAVSPSTSRSARMEIIPGEAISSVHRCEH